jgi:hypothetical protein
LLSSISDGSDDTDRDDHGGIEHCSNAVIFSCIVAAGIYFVDALSPE